MTAFRDVRGHPLAGRAPQVYSCSTFSASFIDMVTFADGACEARSRSKEKAMQGHRRRRATQRSPATPFSPKGGGGTASISLSLLLRDAPDIASSSLRELDALALTTNVAISMNEALGSPRKHNAVGAQRTPDDCGTAVDNLCIIPAWGLFAKIEIAQDSGRHDQQADKLRCGE